MDQWTTIPCIRIHEREGKGGGGVKDSGVGKSRLEYKGGKQGSENLLPIFFFFAG
jgi:hypothetical protein